VGAHAAAVVAPSYYTYDDRALAAYFKEVAHAVAPFPILLYNIPGCAKNALSADFILELAARVDNIVGVKDSSGDMAHLTRLLGHAPKGFHVINGADEYGFQALTAGCPAVVSGTANVTIPIYRALHNALKTDQRQKAWKEQVRLESACRLLGYGGLIALFKEAMRQRGFDPGPVRPPQRELTAPEKKALAQGLKEIGLT